MVIGWQVAAESAYSQSLVSRRIKKVHDHFKPRPHLSCFFWRNIKRHKCCTSCVKTRPSSCSLDSCLTSSHHTMTVCVVSETWPFPKYQEIKGKHFGSFTAQGRFIYDNNDTAPWWNAFILHSFICKQKTIELKLLSYYPWLRKVDSCTRNAQCALKFHAPPNAQNQGQRMDDTNN